MSHFKAPEFDQVPPEILHGGSAEVGGAVLRAMDGSEIDLSGLRAGRPQNATTYTEGRPHLVRVTMPEASRDSGHGVVVFPGFGMAPDYGVGSEVHDALAVQYPHSRVMTIGTEGVGLHCRPIGLLKALSLSFDTMAADRLRITRDFVQSGPVTEISFSMGTRIGLKTVLQNLHAGPESYVGLQHAIYHSHAQVPADRLVPDMARFLLHMSIQNWTEGPRYPRVMLEQMFATTALFGLHAPAYASNAINILHGVTEEDLHTAASNVRTTYISGTMDPLAQPALLEELRTAHPDNVSVLWLPGLGHAASLNAGREARFIANADRPKAA